MKHRAGLLWGVVALLCVSVTPADSSKAQAQPKGDAQASASPAALICITWRRRCRNPLPNLPGISSFCRFV